MAYAPHIFPGILSGFRRLQIQLFERSGPEEAILWTFVSCQRLSDHTTCFIKTTDTEAGYSIVIGSCFIFKSNTKPGDISFLFSLCELLFRLQGFYTFEFAKTSSFSTSRIPFSLLTERRHSWMKCVFIRNIYYFNLASRCSIVSIIATATFSCICWYVSHISASLSSRCEGDLSTSFRYQFE